MIIIPLFHLKIKRVEIRIIRESKSLLILRKLHLLLLLLLLLDVLCRYHSRCKDPRVKRVVPQVPLQPLTQEHINNLRNVCLLCRGRNLHHMMYLSHPFRQRHPPVRIHDIHHHNIKVKCLWIIISIATIITITTIVLLLLLLHRSRR